MSLLVLKVVREFWQFKARTLALIVAFGLLVAMPAGIDMGLRSLLDTRDTFTRELGLPDLELRLLPEDVNNLPSFDDVAGVAAVERRLLMPGQLTKPNGEVLNALLVFLDNGDPRINRLRMLEGRTLPPGANPLAVAERSLPIWHGIGVGAEVRVTIGHHTYAQTIIGVASSPEFLIVASNPEYYLPEKGSLGVLYTRLERVYESLGFRMVNSLMFDFDPDADFERTKAEILERIGNRRVERVIARDEQLSYRHIQVDHTLLEIFSPAITAALALLASILVIININRLLASQSREIGALLALGYEMRRLLAAYFVAICMLCVIGTWLGLGGALALRSAFLTIYSDAHGLAHLEHHLYWGSVLRGGALTLGVASFGIMTGSRSFWNADPLRLLRPAEASVAVLRGRRRQALLRLPMTVRLGISNLLRNPRLSSATTGGLALIIAVGLSYMVGLDSMSAAIHRSFETQRWDLAVDFLYPVLEDDYRAVRETPGVAAAEPFVRSTGTLFANGHSASVSLFGMPDGGTLRKLSFVSGRMPKGADEVAIGSDVSRRLGVRVGDSLELCVRNLAYVFRLTGIKSDVVLFEAILPMALTQKLLELEDQATGALVLQAADADKSATRPALMAQSFVAKTTSRDQLISIFEDVLRDIRKLVLLVTGIAVCVGVLFVVANLAMTVSERSGEYATLWALGASRQAVRWTIMIEASAQTIVALVVAVPLAYALAYLFNWRASLAWFDQATTYSPVVLCAWLAGVLVLTVVGASFSARAFQSSGLLQHLRQRSIE